MTQAAPPLNCSISEFFVGRDGFTRHPKSRSVRCSVSRDDACVPKLEPFSRNKIDRAVNEPPLIQKSQNQIADYCLTLQGDDSYSCWKAYFELKDLQKEVPKEEVERLIMEAGGVKSLINCVHGVSSIHRAKKEHDDKKEMEADNDASLKKLEHARTRTGPVPDGLPKSAEEMEEEEKCRMPDSAFTRLLRARGRFPAWFSPAPEHETD